MRNKLFCVCVRVCVSANKRIFHQYSIIVYELERINGCLAGWLVGSSVGSLDGWVGGKHIIHSNTHLFVQKKLTFTFSLHFRMAVI